MLCKLKIIFKIVLTELGCLQQTLPYSTPSEPTAESCGTKATKNKRVKTPIGQCYFLLFHIVLSQMNTDYYVF